MKQRTMNVEPFHVETSCNSEGFILTFHCHGDKKVKIHMNFWWVEYLARELWKILKHQRTMLSDGENAMHGDKQ